MTINAVRTLGKAIMHQTIVGADICHDNSGPSLTFWFADGTGIAIEAIAPHVLDWKHVTLPREEMQP